MNESSTRRNLTEITDACFDLHREEAQEYVAIGTINGLFVLGRCTGFIGMQLDFCFEESSSSFFV